MDTIFALNMSIPIRLEDIWDVSEHKFNDIALDLFRFHAKSNPVYAQYLDLIDKRTKDVYHFSEIPFLPISFFKTHPVRSYPFEAEVEFKSSSTTGVGRSTHSIPNLGHYLDNSRKIFESHYGRLQDLEILALLPNYLEQGDSSLVAMVDHFIAKSETSIPAHFLYDHQELLDRIEHSTKDIVLFGVSYALLDFAESRKSTLKFTIIETGGMKGRKKEWTKAELHSQILSSFPNARIHSEYGMTELMSQAYASDGIKYQCPPWMKVLLRSDNDPFGQIADKRGAINIIDLANIHSCAFIATDDLGKLYDDGSFEVLGRLDHSDIRGCSQLAL